MIWEVIRVSEDYRVILVALKNKPTDNIFTDDMFFVVHNSNFHAESKTFLADPDDEESLFVEISRNEALGYGSHQADGLGFGEFPEKNEFTDLKDIWVQVKAKSDTYYSNRYGEISDKQHYLNWCWLIVEMGLQEGIILRGERNSLHTDIEKGSVNLDKLIEIYGKLKYKDKKIPDEEKEEIIKAHNIIFGP